MRRGWPNSTPALPTNRGACEVSASFGNITQQLPSTCSLSAVSRRYSLRCELLNLPPYPRSSSAHLDARPTHKSAGSGGIPELWGLSPRTFHGALAQRCERPILAAPCPKQSSVTSTPKSAALPALVFGSRHAGGRPEPSRRRYPCRTVQHALVVS